MKKLFVFLFAVTVSASSFAQYKGGSNEGGRQNVVKVNPLGLVFGSATVSYERAIQEKSSVQVDLMFGGLNVVGVKYTNFGAGVNYRYFLGAEAAAPEKFYVSGGAGFYSLKVKENGGTSVSGSGAIVKAVVGHQWIWSSGFALDLFAGVNYYAGGKIKGSGGVEYTKFNGVLPALGVSLGYAF